MDQTPEECNSGVSNVLKRSKESMDRKLVSLESNKAAKMVLSILHEETPSKRPRQHHSSFKHVKNYYSEDAGETGKAQGKPLPSRVKKGSVSKTRDPVYRIMQNYFAKDANVSNDFPRVLLENHKRSSHLETRTEKNMAAAKAFFPDFFPRQLVQNSYDYLREQPTLEQIFSGHVHGVLTGK